jgi:diguanylate cyclase (GGDEF)-like protein
VRQKTVELEEANRQLHQRNLMLERLALTDELTGLPNRRAIDQILQSEVRRRSRYPSTLAVGLIDADHFKEINTRHLYPGGDQVLASLATVLSTSIRGMDTVGRIGGEEFVVIAPITDQDGARGLGERIRQAVSHHAVRYQGNDIRVTVSVGVAVADADVHVAAEQFMYEAAVALGEAKARGRNCCVTRALTSSLCETPVAIPEPV